MRIAGVQCDIRLKHKDHNLATITKGIRETSSNNATLTVFPECTVAGYCFTSKDEAVEYAEPIPGVATEVITRTCRDVDHYAVVGMIERVGEDIFNASVLVGPTGVIAVHRKIHLPFLGVDRFTTPGNRPFSVADTNESVVGMMICYDASFPESARCLSLLGADLITLPTNWPPGAERVAANTIACRALENGVYIIAVNRVGTEGSFRFIGQSQICDPSGNVLHMASDTNEEIFYADIDVERAREKHVIRVPGEHEIDRFADRRPEMYALLTQPHSLCRPGRDT